jgi:hypothetical protein
MMPQWYAVKTRPRHLVAMIYSHLHEPSELTFAAETLGSIPDPQLVMPVLRDLLEHSSPLVREGAVYGLAQQRTPEAKSLLCKVAREDPSRGVRDAAADYLIGIWTK